MLLIQAVANTMLLSVVIAGGLVTMNRILVRVMEQSFARIAAAEATNLDEQLRGLTDS